VLSDLLGMTNAAIDELERDGVIATAPRQGLISARQLDLDGLLTSNRLLEIDQDFGSRLESQFAQEPESSPGL
jgi:hypothetical protein